MCLKYTLGSQVLLFLLSRLLYSSFHYPDPSLPCFCGASLSPNTTEQKILRFCSITAVSQAARSVMKWDTPRAVFLQRHLTPLDAVPLTPVCCDTPILLLVNNVSPLCAANSLSALLTPRIRPPTVFTGAKARAACEPCPQAAKAQQSPAQLASISALACASQNSW